MSGKFCWCGEPATRTCLGGMGALCGAPLCDDDDHRDNCKLCGGVNEGKKKPRTIDQKLAEIKERQATFKQYFHHLGYPDTDWLIAELEQAREEISDLNAECETWDQNHKDMTDERDAALAELKDLEASGRGV